MLAVLLILVPGVAAAAVFVVPSNRWRPWVVTCGAACHAALTVYAVSRPFAPPTLPWFHLDGLSRYFLVFITIFFLILTTYLPSYLANNGHRSNRVLCACMLASLSAMTAVIVARHLAVLWIAVEATTLATAPCIYFEHNSRALEATWKYLMLCSVGIALALLGTFFLAYSSLHHGSPTLQFDALIAQAGELSPEWLRLAFIFVLVGYGTKMGLAPMHTWLPDAHSESPAVVSALLSGALLNCAFLGIVRVYLVVVAAGQVAMIQPLLLFIGLFSMAFAAVAICRQRDIKRLVAYSSVEHMGMMAFGLGVGGIGVPAALLHVMHNGLTKGVLFLAAGNICHAYGTRSMDQMHGVLRRVPWSGLLFVAGFFVITGAPGGGPFVSEIMMLAGAFERGHLAAGCLFIGLLFLVFIGMGSTVLGCALGPRPEATSAERERWGETLPILAALLLVIALGFYTPPFVTDWIHHTVATPTTSVLVPPVDAAWGTTIHSFTTTPRIG